MKKALYILGVLSVLGLCYAGGYHFTLARVQSEGVVPFSLTRETYLQGQLVVTQHTYRKSNGDRAEVTIPTDHDADVTLWLFSTGHMVGLIPDRGVRTSYTEEPLAKAMAYKQAELRRSASDCRVNKSDLIAPTPVEIMGQPTYHIRSVGPCKAGSAVCGKVMDAWHAPALGCQALKFTVGNDVVGRVTQLKIGEPDPAIFDEHPEFPLTPDKR